MIHPIPTQLSGAELAIATRGLAKYYGETTALRDVALQVPVGATYLLVGPNGAGKSTTLKILLDLVRADRGVAEVFGLNVQHKAPQVRANIGYVPEHTDWGYGWMQVGRLLEHHAQYFPTWDATYAARLVSLFQVDVTRRMDVLSKGQARRVHLMLALAHRPPLLLLDEPTDGLDPTMRDEMLGVLADHFAETTTTVLLSTHHVEEVEQLADHIGVLRDGALQAQMSMETLRRNLSRYQVEIPEGWSGISTLNTAVLRKVATSREIQWTIWGEEAEVRRQFAATNAMVREVRPLSLIDATIVLLNPQR
jgi:ABC-2 type transport system ATP-binding protein